jgi:hypothetical protein
MVEVFSPPWWRLDRWLWWFLFARGRKAALVFAQGERKRTYRGLILGTEPARQAKSLNGKSHLSMGDLSDAQRATASQQHIAELRRQGFIK